jgi:predicted Zn-dependent peptidase
MLANGLRVRTVEHATMQVISFVVQVEGGSGADAEGQEGLVALVADMVDEGTGDLNAIDVSDALARIGAEYGVEVESDVTTFSLTTLARFATRGAALLADLLIRPSLRQADFDRVRQLRLNRLRQLKDMPAAVAERTFLECLYPHHPYGHLAIGNERTLSGLALEDVIRLHHACMRPSRTTVVAAGAMSHEGLLEIVRDAFGGWPEPPLSELASSELVTSEPASHAVGPHVRASAVSPASAGTGRRAADLEAPPAAPGIIVVPRQGAAQSELRIGHVSARRDTPDYSALLVMNAVLGGQFVSRVNLKLREEKALTYGARTGFDWKRGPSPFSLATSVQSTATIEALRDSLAEIESIRGAKPVTDAELAMAKASLTRGYPRGFETVQQVARATAQLALYGLPDSYFEHFVPAVNAVSQADVTRVAAQYLDPARLTVVVVGDPAVIGDPAMALGLAPMVLPESTR